MTRTGSCFCGAVTYRIKTEVFGARSCHCSRCRKAFSAQASAYALVQPGSFSWVSGEEYLSVFPPEGPASKAFCRICGSALCGIYEGEVHGITLGCLNEDEGIELKAHIFTGSKAAWEDLPAGVPKFEEFPPDLQLITKP
ncbi:hypothetical protein RSK20926_13269 [Roseobacter sp. SK209-2-6]|uniref:GFA family protein n=1 Tax=Roseobacter sp. SK209-2-6 TaxID=388739 RepID=UPI0000F3C646|nr:GFA family protein [Roseobacter sp. SK209-2-6]EBA18695.1 hypothetical protein RSK20926_13269 [Roseobacter sp. SK209-2-6]